MSRAAQTERNRGLVLEAARRVFLAAGYHGARLDAIAEEAGFSKGVVYSQFAGKADLFLALLEQRIVERARTNAELAAEHAGVEGLRALLLANERREQEDAWAQLLIEFRVAAAREPGVNARYAALHECTLEHFGEAVRRVLERGGLVPVYPPPVFADLILTLGAGRVLEEAAGTARFDVEILVDLLRRLIEPAPSSSDREAS